MKEIFWDPSVGMFGAWDNKGPLCDSMAAILILNWMNEVLFGILNKFLSKEWSAWDSIGQLG